MVFPVFFCVVPEQILKADVVAREGTGFLFRCPASRREKQENDENDDKQFDHGADLLLIRFALICLTGLILAKRMSNNPDF
jgi:hypothetical protein